MGRLEKLFSSKKDKILNVYCTAGYPDIDSTLTVMQSLQENGSDLIELGMPYSDPLADGPVIQKSSSKAIENGMTIDVLFKQLKEFRKLIDIPVILMGYLNPVLQYGFEKFCSKSATCGIDGLIIPDLPVYEYENEYARIIKNYGLDFIFLITPETSIDRIRKLDSLTSGFLYAVSSSSLTGSEKDFEVANQFLELLQSMKLNNPILVGFGIKDKKSFEEASKYTRGAIIGSAYIKILEENNDIKSATQNFLKSILD